MTYTESDAANKRRYYLKHKEQILAQRKRHYIDNCVDVRAYQNNMKRDRKIFCIHEKGDACSVCGVKYDGENAAIFEFHHVDPSTKELEIGSSMMGVAWERTLAELDKCILVCANCHHLIHAGKF